MRKICAVVLFSLATLVPADVLPRFTLPAMDGGTFKMGEHVGEKIFVIDFWASWCQPCKALLKRLQELKDKNPGVEVIAITIDDAAAQPQAVNYIKAKRYTFVVLFDADGQVAKMFNPTLKVPFTLIVDRKGDIVYSHAGYMPGVEDEIAAAIARIGR